MRKLKLSLKKEIISSLEAKSVTGGANTGLDCHSEVPICKPMTYYECKTVENTCLTDCEMPSMNGCELTEGVCGSYHCK